MTTSASSLEATLTLSSNRAVSSASAPPLTSANHARVDEPLLRRAVPKIGHAGELIDTGVLGLGFGRQLQSSPCGITDMISGVGEGYANYTELALQIQSVCNHGVEIEGKNITLAECLATVSDASSEAVAQYKEVSPASGSAIVSISLAETGSQTIRIVFVQDILWIL